MRYSSRANSSRRGRRGNQSETLPVPAAVAIAVALAITASACGSNGDDAADPSSPVSPSGNASGTATLDPDSSPTVTGPSGSGPVSDSGTATSVTTTSPATPGADFAAAVAASLLVDPFAAGLNVAGYQGWAEFQTPSGRIYCALSDGTTFDGTSADAFVRCDITEATYDQPPRPADCELDYGFSFGLSPKKAGSLLCVSDVALLGEGPPSTLRYGERVELGGFICVSAEDGVRCASSDYGNGFRVARVSYELY